MFRVPEPWEFDALAKKKLSCGYASGLDTKYERTGQSLGKGGFGQVVVVKQRANGLEYACKSIQKLLDVPNISAARQEQHLSNIKQEVSVLRKLRGTLNVVHLEDVFEDDDCVHIVMELCRGGELLSKINSRHYSERTVASYMRAVLRTLAQCHHHRILHRDIKPGNFMLLTDAEDAPVKAIDFGLAVFFDAKALPVRHLGLEGTPHYMAPEVLSSEVWPESDVWAAGVMAYQLLSGQFPFDDWKNSRNPALSQLWKSILTEEPKFSGRGWQDVTDGAKDFIRHLLVKDVKQRPSAQQALSHPWIQGKKVQRKEGKPLAATIVQRLQRFSTENAFKRTVLDMIANELLARHLNQQLQQQQQAAAVMAAMPAGSRPGSQQAASGQGCDDHSPPAASSLAPGDSPPGEARQASAAAAAGITPSASKRLHQLRRDPSSPHLRSLAACSLISQLHNKSATVHAGSGAARMLLRGISNASAASAAAEQSGAAASRKVSIDLAGATGYLPPSSPHRAKSELPAGSTAAALASTAPPSDAVTEHAQEPLAPQRSPDSESMTLIAHMPMPEGYVSPATSPSMGSIAAATGGPRQVGTHIQPAGARPGSLPRASPQPPSPVSPMADGMFGSMPSTMVKGASGAPIKRGFAGEGSGHALSHYAFLLAAGERSLHGLSQRQSFQRSQSHASLQHIRGPAALPPMNTPGTPGSIGAGGLQSGGPAAQAMPIAAAAGSRTPPSHHAPVGSSSYQPPSMLLGMRPTKDFAASRRSVDHQHASSVHGASLGLPHPSHGQQQQAPGAGMDDVQKLLLAVQRQRQEHRKLQRLMLDTSGHAQSLYQASMQGRGEASAVPDLPRVSEAAPQHPADGAPSAPDGDMEVDGDSEASGAAGGSKKGGILHKVSRALLQPVKEMLGGRSNSSPSQPSSSHVSGAFGSHIPSADPSMHAIQPSDGGRSKEGSQHHARTSSTPPGSGVGLAHATLTDRPSLTLQEVLATEHAEHAGSTLQNTGEAAGKHAAANGSEEQGPSFESGGRGRGAYAALLATLNTSPAAGEGAAAQPAADSQPAAGAAAQIAQAAVPAGSSSSTSLGMPPVTEVATPSMGMAIHTVKAHKRQPTMEEVAADASSLDDHTIAAQLARIEQQAGVKDEDIKLQGDGTVDGTAHVGGTVSKGKLYDILGHLLGGPAQLAEFQAVMSKLKYDTQTELSFDEISKGLQCLGYRLEPSEVAVLLSEVALGSEHISQGAFLASQVDWRQFQANHREEWLSLLRKTFDGLARQTDGRIGEDEIVALLSSKLPEDEVNLAVQETLLDAAVLGAEGLDFDDFARLLAAPSEADLLSLGSPSGSATDISTLQDDSQHLLRRVPSIDLYDARVLDGSQHGARNNPSVHSNRASLEAGVQQGGGVAGIAPQGPVVAGIAPSDLVAGAQFYLPPSWLAGQIETAQPVYHPALETVPDEEAE